jgi:hypothetical protein
VRFKRESISWMMSLGAVGEERSARMQWAVGWCGSARILVMRLVIRGVLVGEL